MMRLAHLLLACLLLLGDFLHPHSPRVTFAQVDDEDDEKADKEEEKEDKDDVSEYPSLVPSPEPTTGFPTSYPTQLLTIAPTFDSSDSPTATIMTTSPSASPSTVDDGALVGAKLFEARLPEIVITFESSIPTTFSSTSTSSSSSGETLVESDVAFDDFEERMNPYFQGFVESLLTTSRVIPELAQPTTSILIKLIPTSMNDVLTAKATDIAAVEQIDQMTSRTLMSIVIDGTVAFYDVASIIEGEKDSNATSSKSFEDSIRHSLIVYFTFWGPENTEVKLESFGLPSPKVQFVFVDGSQLLERNNDTDGGGLVVVVNNIEESVQEDEGEAADGTTNYCQYTSRSVMYALIGGLAMLLSP
jgi:hypothetical protein